MSSILLPFCGCHIAVYQTRKNNLKPLLIFREIMCDKEDLGNIVSYGPWRSLTSDKQPSIWLLFSGPSQIKSHFRCWLLKFCLNFWSPGLSSTVPPLIASISTTAILQIVLAFSFLLLLLFLLRIVSSSMIIWALMPRLYLICAKCVPEEDGYICLILLWILFRFLGLWLEI